VSGKKTSRKTLIFGLTVALVFVMAGVFCFSYALETLDVKAEELGVAEQPIYEPPFPDYSIVGFENQWGALVVGIASTLLLFGVGLVVAKVLNKKKGKVK
jgi:amino acid transporter